MHDTGPSAAAAPPGFETALQDFLNSGATPGPTAEPDEAVNSLQQLSASLKAMLHQKRDVLDTNLSQQVPSCTCHCIPGFQMPVCLAQFKRPCHGEPLLPGLEKLVCL